MKKFILFALLSLNAFALDLYLGATANYGSEWNPKVLPIDKSNYKDVTYGVNLELTQVIPLMELGLGAAYEYEYILGTSSYDAVPVYGLVKINLFPMGVKPYLVAKYGITYYVNQKNTTMIDGDFYSAGLGLTLFKKIQAEATYSLSTGKKDGNDLNVTKASLILRYNLF